MKFKDYINEKNDSSRAIWAWIKSWRLPLSPKFMAEVFPENNNITCFRAVPPERISTLWRRAKSKKQVSTFTDFRDYTIFWGAGSFQWKNKYQGNMTTVSVLKGNTTIKGTVDLWTFPDGMGRRWIDVLSIQKYRTPFSDVLGLIVQDIKVNFPKRLEKLKRDLSFYDYHTTPKGNIVFDELNDDTFKNKDKNKIIKLYMDVAYDSIKKYQNQLRKSTKNLAQDSHYNEYPCYNYTLQKVIVYVEYTKGNTDFQKLEKELIDNNINYVVVNKAQDIEKILKSQT